MHPPVLIAQSGSFPAPLSNHLRNLPLAAVYSVHPVGQAVRLNAIIAPVGTIPPFVSAFESRVLRSERLSTTFPKSVDVSGVPQIYSLELMVKNAAYPMESIISVPKNTSAE